MYPSFFSEGTNSPTFNPFEDYDHHHPLPPPEFDTTAAHEHLPPLQDVDHTIDNTVNHYNNQFHDHTPNFDQLDQLPNTDSNLESKSKSQSMSKSTTAGSLELLSRYRSKFKFLREEESSDEIAPDCSGTLSTVEIIKLAAEKFINFSTQRTTGYTMFTHPYGSSAFTRLSIDEIREVELVFQLLTAAERVGRKQFEIADKFLARCGCVASNTGTPVERLVYYLCEGLEKRIGKETGRPVPTKPKKIDQKNQNPMALETNPTFLTFHQSLPFNQVLHFCGIQAIIDQLGTSTKVHMIDIHIRSGVQWTAMIQALAERQPETELLKLTAFATSSDVESVEETGKRLENFAKTLNLPFLFKMLVLSDIMEVKTEQFEVQDDEAVAVYCHLILRTMLSRPQSLENLMRAIRRINPLVIVVSEVEANHNSTSFVNRFTEALFFYGAFFDCFEACMSRDDAHRAVLEGVHFADWMKNIVADEGDERINRSVNIKTWRLFFARFGMVEINLTESCVYQANLVLQQFSCVTDCMLENNDRCLVVGWKGTPFFYLSTWKFGKE